MMLMLISITSNVEHHKDFEKIKDGSILQIPMVGSSGVLDVGQIEGL